MIVAKRDTPLVVAEPSATQDELDRARAASEEFRKNVEWFGAHAAEIRNAHAGRFICIIRQVLFVGDDPIEVVARANAAHPVHPGGSFSMRLSTHQGPKIYAH